MSDKEVLIGAAKTIANYCRNHICTDCPLNLASKAESIIKAHCVCDYNILHLPSTWKVEDFVFISSVVEAESDRSESLDGRILIALTIINRVEDPRFPDTISEVLTQRGQFSTVRNNQSIIDRTDLSDQAVIEAVEWNEAGDDPNVLFFNCNGYGIGEPYGLIDGNYFTTMEAEK